MKGYENRFFLADCENEQISGTLLYQYKRIEGMDKMDFGAVIGLEIHAQLLTKTKIFCRCSTRFGASPNANTCPVCLGLPGALPVLNRQAVAMALKVGMALNCRINSPSLFARKNYFYPDLPKGFQISQLELPLA